MNGKLEATMGAAWSAVEVFDGSKNQLRFELFGSGDVVTVTMEGDHASSLNMSGMEFKRTR